MRLRLRALAAVASVCLTAVAHADTLSNFTFSNVTFQSGATGQGSLTIDTATGTVTDLSFQYTSSGPSFTFNTITDQTADPIDNTYIVTSSVGNTASLILGIGSGSIVGYAGGSLCTTATPCSGGNSIVEFVLGEDLGADYFQSGDLTSSSPVPEPSALVFTLTGLACAGRGILRRCR